MKIDFNNGSQQGTASRVTPASNSPSTMVNILMKLGLAKSTADAQKVFLIIVVICFVVTALFVFKQNQAQQIDEKYYYQPETDIGDN